MFTKKIETRDRTWAFPFCSTKNSYYYIVYFRITPFECIAMLDITPLQHNHLLSAEGFFWSGSIELTAYNIQGKEEEALMLTLKSFSVPIHFKTKHKFYFVVNRWQSLLRKPFHVKYISHRTYFMAFIIYNIWIIYWYVL